MKSPYVKELQANQTIQATFLVQAKDVRQKKSGEPYLLLQLADRTGEIEGRMWDNAGEALDTFERDDFLRVKGLCHVHQNRMQLTIHKLQRLEPHEVDFRDYFPASERSPDEMFAELRGIIDGIQEPCLQQLLNVIFADEEVARRFRLAPAAKVIHHAYLGGLLEHVLSLCALARLTAEHYKTVDLDLLLTGVILHDIGKIHELTYDRSFGYSTEGQLLGHIVIGLRMVEEKIAQVPGFPARLRTLLSHMLISHHGELEYGSPKVPLFLEALLLHHLDNLDSKMEAMRSHAERDRLVDGHWSAYSTSLDRAVLKKARYLEETIPAVSIPLPAAEAVPASAPSRGAEPSVRPPRDGRGGSAFAEKLQLALKPKP